MLHDWLDAGDIAAGDYGFRRHLPRGLQCRRRLWKIRAADNGATVYELESSFGWQRGGMAALYTRTANRNRASQRAMPMMERPTDEHSIASPDQKVRLSGLKDQ
jgi:hypothetical protein